MVSVYVFLKSVSTGATINWRSANLVVHDEMHFVGGFAPVDFPVYRFVCQDLMDAKMP